ncbi:LysR family transcriptional regulator (plasmid) [Pseudalkalibacillus hwajinpoensis]|uniref:LysR family transcriptional regulator n=1 Tax=Guptibacillus hwajinpoensis TaxID=208199 RepID=UPI00325B6044
MDMKQLSTFQTASETLNFTKSAKILNYAQSSVTSQIKSLEDELGVSLFERLGNKLVLTPFGVKFKVYTDSIISQYHSVLDEINYDKNMTATLIVGATESQCAYKLPTVLTEFKILFPKVKVIVKPMHNLEQIQSDLQTGELDFAFLFGENFEETNSVQISKLSKENLVLVASPLNEVNNLKKPSLNDLQKETILLTEKGCSYRNLLENMIADSNMSFSSTFEITNVETLKNCVKSNLGIALLPYGVVKDEVSNQKLKIIDWNPPSNPELFHFVSWHKDKKFTSLLDTFVSVSENIFQ